MEKVKKKNWGWRFSTNLTARGGATIRVKGELIQEEATIPEDTVSWKSSNEGVLIKRFWAQKKQENQKRGGKFFSAQESIPILLVKVKETKF